MTKVNIKSVEKYGANNMRGNPIRKVGEPIEGDNALTWSIPKYTTTERDAIVINSTNYLIIFNTTTSKLNFYDGGAWRAITST